MDWFHNLALAEEQSQFLLDQFFGYNFNANIYIYVPQFYATPKVTE